MKTDWRLIGLLFLVGLLAAAQFAKIALSLDALRAVYPGAPLPFAVSALSVAGILFGVTAGVIVARLGARRVLLAAMCAAAALSALQATLPPFPAMMALRLAEGLTHLSMVVSAPTLMAAVATPRDKPVAMGLWGTFFGIGFAGTALVLPLLPGPAAAFLLHAAALLVLAALLWPILPRGVARDPHRIGMLERHRQIYTSARMIAPALGFFFHTSVFLGLLTFLPRFLGAWSGAVLPLAALVGTLGAGVLARRVAPRTILAAAFAAATLGFVLAAVVPEAALGLWMILLFGLVGLLPGASFANVPALNTEGPDQARANGALAQMGNVGTALSTPIFAAAAGLGLAGPLVLAGALSALGLIVVLLIHRRIGKTA